MTTRRKASGKVNEKVDDSTNESTKVVMPVLIPQPGGRGSLNSGGTPGNKGGRNGGPKPAAFRQLARNILKNRKLLPRLADIAEGNIGEIKTDGMLKQYTETPIREQRGAIDTLLRYGVGETKELSSENVRDRLQRTVNVIREQLPPEDAKRLLDALEPIWA